MLSLSQRQKHTTRSHSLDKSRARDSCTILWVWCQPGRCSLSHSLSLPLIHTICIFADTTHTGYVEWTQCLCTLCVENSRLVVYPKKSWPEVCDPRALFLTVYAYWISKCTVTCLGIFWLRSCVCHFIWSFLYFWRYGSLPVCLLNKQLLLRLTPQVYHCGFYFIFFFL